MHQRTCFSRSLCVLDSKSSFRETSPPGGHRDDARRLPYCSGEPQSRCHFRKECSREKSFCPNKARFPGRPVPRKSPAPRCLSRLRRARAPDLTNPPTQPPASFPSSPQAHPLRSPPPENAGSRSPASKRKSSNLSLHSCGEGALRKTQAPTRMASSGKEALLPHSVHHAAAAGNQRLRARHSLLRVTVPCDAAFLNRSVFMAVTAHSCLSPYNMQGKNAGTISLAARFREQSHSLRIFGLPRPCRVHWGRPGRAHSGIR